MPELLLRRTLWGMGVRYRKNVQSLPGKPDLVFPGARVVVFCDGDFWHGRRWKSLRRKLGERANAPYWIRKIGANRARDQQTRARLRLAGWSVVSLWESDVRRDPLTSAQRVVAAVRPANHGDLPKPLERKLRRSQGSRG